MPWAELLLAFLSPLCFESEQARAQAVLPFRSGGYAICLNKGAGGGNQVAYALKTIMALIHMSAITKSNLNIKLKLLKHFL